MQYWDNPFNARVRRMGIDPDASVYRLTYADAMAVIADKITEEQFHQLTNEQLHKLIHGVADNFENIDWYEWGQAGLDYIIYDNEDIEKILGKEMEK